MQTQRHQSVLTDKVLEYLLTKKDGIYIDATLGDGGYAEKILESLDSNGRVIGIDLDPLALINSKTRLKKYGKRIQIIRGNFAEVERIVREEVDVKYVDGVVFDIGLRNEHVEDPKRGFSFKHKGPLDMRFDIDQKKSAFTVLNKYPADKLLQIFKNYCDLREANKLIFNILKARSVSPIGDTLKFAEIVMISYPKKIWKDVIPRVFQAIRIEVNNEFENLKAGLYGAVKILKTGGRVAVVSYHSGEDRIVKNYFLEESKDCVCPPRMPVCRCGHRKTLKILTKKPLISRADEIEKNPRARSASLRAAEKVEVLQ